MYMYTIHISLYNVFLIFFTRVAGTQAGWADAVALHISIYTYTHIYTHTSIYVMSYSWLVSLGSQAIDYRIVPGSFPNPVVSVRVCATLSWDAAAGGLTAGWWAIVLKCFSSHPLWYLFTSFAGPQAGRADAVALRHLLVLNHWRLGGARIRHWILRCEHI